MRELVFLLEEESARAFLQGLLPRFLDPRVQPRWMVFEGKQDLERQLVRRLRGYANPLARFIVLRDQDSTPDCKIVKTRLRTLCAQAGRDDVTLVRIACRELESFYIADLRAVESALPFPGLSRRQSSRRFREADHLESPSHELARLTRGAYQKVGGSRRIGPHMDLANERSRSFKNLLAGIRRLEQELLALPA